MSTHSTTTAPARREAAERELPAARAAVSPSRFERALERVQAAQEAAAQEALAPAA